VLGFVIVYAKLSLPAPGYSGPPVPGETATVNAVDEPTWAEPVPEPVLEKYANAAPATASMATTETATAVRFLRILRMWHSSFRS
jgi:hypothetical protein